jgi:hypothetical protein
MAKSISSAARELLARHEMLHNPRVTPFQSSGAPWSGARPETARNTVKIDGPEYRRNTQQNLKGLQVRCTAVRLLEATKLPFGCQRSTVSATCRCLLQAAIDSKTDDNELRIYECVRAFGLDAGTRVAPEDSHAKAMCRRAQGRRRPGPRDRQDD